MALKQQAGRISALQFAVLIAAGYVGVGIFPFPRELVATAGAQAVYAFLLECAAALTGLWLWFQVNRIDPDRPLPAFACRLVSPVLGYPLLLLTLVLHLALAVVVITDFAFVMHTFFLIETPLWAVKISLMLTAIYVAWFDVTPLARTVQFVFAPAIVLSVLMGLLLLPRLTSAYALIPGTALHPDVILLAAYKGFYIFWGYELTVTLYPFVHKSERPLAERYAYRAMAGTFLFFALGYTLTLGSEGPQLLSISIWPGVSTMRLINVSAFLINKLGLLLVSLWGIFVLAFTAVRVWCLAHDVLPVIRRDTATWYRGLLLLFGALALFGSAQFATATDLAAFSEHSLLPAIVLYNLGLPPLLLAAAVIARRRHLSMRSDTA